MRKGLFFILIFTLLSSSLPAQKRVVLQVTDLGDEALRLKISYYSSIIVNEINRAWQNAGVPVFPDECLTEGAYSKILQLWKSSPFRIIVNDTRFKGIFTAMGYQIRGLPVEIQADTSVHLQAVINFGPEGKIENFHFAIDYTVYKSLVDKSDSSEDQEKRKRMLDFIEDFRTAYNRKDLSLISCMYGDDVMIITGYVYKITGDKMTLTGLSKEKVEYNIYDKKEYLLRLGKVFEKNHFVNVDFDTISIMRHPSLKNFYSVTLLQHWKSSSYGDDGWLFLAIEFISDKDMLVHIRTWQPYLFNGLIFPRSEVFQLGNFEFR